MENSVNVVHLERKISRLSCNYMKKQDSLRYHMFSGLLVMVEMLRALHSLWDAIFPFALLWWNLMLCATCAKYYSWSWSRLHLQMAGRCFYDEVVGELNAEEIEEKSALVFHHTEEVLQTEMKVIASDQSGSCTQAFCGQKVDVGSCYLKQSWPSFQDYCIRDMFLHDPHVDNIEMCTEEHIDDEVEELHLEASVVSIKVHVSQALNTSCTSKLFSLRFFDEKGTQQSDLLKVAYWTACPLLLPQQVARLALYDAAGGPQKSFECPWMESTLSINRKLMSVKAPMQVLYDTHIDFSTLEELLQISGVSLVSWISLMIHSKEHAYLAKQFAKFLTSRARGIDNDVMQLGLSRFDDCNLTKSIGSVEALEETINGMTADIEKHPSLLLLLDLERKSANVGYVDGKGDEGAGKDIGSDYSTSKWLLNGHNGDSESGSQSRNDEFQDGDAVQCLQIDVDDDRSFHSRCPEYEDSIVDSGKEMEFLNKSSIFINDNYYDLYDRSDWDMRYDEAHCFPEEDSMYGGYYNAPNGVYSDYTHYDDTFVGDVAVRGDTFFDDDAAHGKSSEMKQSHLSADTWWDEDAVLLDTQECEEDSMEQAWQVV